MASMDNTLKAAEQTLDDLSFRPAGRLETQIDRLADFGSKLTEVLNIVDPWHVTASSAGRLAALADKYLVVVNEQIHESLCNVITPADAEYAKVVECGLKWQKLVPVLQRLEDSASNLESRSKCEESRAATDMDFLNHDFDAALVEAVRQVPMFLYTSLLGKPTSLAEAAMATFRGVKSLRDFLNDAFEQTPNGCTASLLRDVVGLAPDAQEEVIIAPLRRLAEIATDGAWMSDGMRAANCAAHRQVTQRVIEFAVDRLLAAPDSAQRATAIRRILDALSPAGNVCCELKSATTSPHPFVRPESSAMLAWIEKVRGRFKQASGAGDSSI